MVLSIFLVIYLILAGILVLSSIIAIIFTWRFRYLGPATGFVVSLLVGLILANGIVGGWVIATTDWNQEILLPTFDTSFSSTP